MAISFDDRGRVLLHGTPRFVLGVYDSGSGYGTTDAFWESLLWSPTGERRMEGLRINAYLNYWYGQAPASAMTSLMTSRTAVPRGTRENRASMSCGYRRMHPWLERIPTPAGLFVPWIR